ncbi:MAG: branched-chain amino acid ABC transporter substrate-binding protein [Planctomycetia bacterium]|nr:branched-chain amino acid ABC transporter substrate-binding protein [Planctomycetia bacterium]
MLRAGMLRGGVLCVCGLAFGLPFGCSDNGGGGGGGNPNVIKIVSSLPRTGSANAQTGTIVNGIKMAIDEVGGKVGDFTIVYEDWDDATPQRGNWDPSVEAGNADKAIKDPDIMAYIGTYNSGAAKISMPKLNKVSLLMISPANTAVGLTKPGKGEPNEPDVYRPSGKINYYRVVPADDIQGVVGAEWAKELGAKRVFVLHDRELYGKGVADIFKKRAEEIGLEVVGYEGIDVKATNYTPLASKVNGTTPDLVYFGGTTQSNGGQLAKDLRSSGFSKMLMAPDGCVEMAFIESAGAQNVNGNTYATFGGLPADRLTGKGAEFYKKYKEKYNTEPEVYSVYGYESAKVVLAAIAKAGVKDREAILKAVGEIKEFDGALGKWSFDANGDTSLTTMSGQIVKDGKWEFVKVLGGE